MPEQDDTTLMLFSMTEVVAVVVVVQVMTPTTARIMMKYTTNAIMPWS